MDRLIDTVSRARLGGIADTLALGGPVVALLLVLSVVVVTVAVGKWVGFRAAGVGRHAAAWAAVRQHVAGDTAAARRRVARGPVSAAVVRYAIDAAAAMPAPAARDAAETVAVLRLHRLRRLTGVLDIVAQIAPLLGLFGTVLGMIDAFRVLEGQGASVDPSALAGGIWVALLTTAVGLAVAMPSSVLAAWFERQVENEEVALSGLIAALFSRTLPPEGPPRGRRR
ncbi:MotA/TolQ/ExbB proton channel family protein [Acuticoccus yangtzensis]|uniref:MotA/TolQ/ExbB proton channel family protein n=1 Tax=Acuticoccus yangtzensis TaxID=1443441 RepID=UPI0009495FFF|nr:MotA/TolQ/ExbB proton channel family protein [Acuticoccus yangtzensis]